jgi:hypothetical protein
MEAAANHDRQLIRVKTVRRFTTAEKVNVVLRILNGESVDALSQQLGISVRRMQRWQNEFIIGGSAALDKRNGSGSSDFVSKHAAAIFRWFAVLTILTVLFGLVSLFLQSGKGR